MTLEIMPGRAYEVELLFNEKIRLAEYEILLNLLVILLIAMSKFELL